VKIAGQSVKPSRDVRVGDVVQARAGYVNRTVKVLGLLQRRVGPKVALDFVEELTPLRSSPAPAMKPPKTDRCTRPASAGRRKATAAMGGLYGRTG
jgi:hypothetical protein